MISSLFELAGFVAGIDFRMAHRGNSNEPSSSELRSVDAVQPPAKSAIHNADDAPNRAAAVVGFESDDSRQLANGCRVSPSHSGI
jgi:hypothetical protein